MATKISFLKFVQNILLVCISFLLISALAGTNVFHPVLASGVPKVSGKVLHILPGLSKCVWELQTIKSTSP